MMDYNKIYQGSALEILKTFPDNTIDMCMTSPPYWALRDYGVDGQLGLEKTFQEYITKLCDIFDEVKRVLKKEGTCFVNIGDSYNNSGWASKDGENRLGGKTGKTLGRADQGRGGQIGYPDKCLCQIPSRFAIEMTNRGWILRNEIIWYKRNCMPSSVNDRFTVDFERIFFFTKNKKYYFEQQFDKQQEISIRRAFSTNHIEQRKDNENSEHAISSISQNKTYEKLRDKINSGEEINRNKRCVWDITTKGYREAHFATYPEELCITPIKAGCPEFICKKCGKPRYPIYKSNRNKEEEKKIVEEINNKSRSKYTGNGQVLSNDQTTGMQHRDTGPNGEKGLYRKSEIIGYSDCGCGEGFVGGIVLDPFMGAGTTGLVAKKLGRQYVGIELNPKYIEIAEKRIYNETGLL